MLCQLHCIIWSPANPKGPSPFWKWLHNKCFFFFFNIEKNLNPNLLYALILEPITIFHFYLILESWNWNAFFVLLNIKISASLSFENASLVVTYSSNLYLHEPHLVCWGSIDNPIVLGLRLRCCCCCTLSKICWLISMFELLVLLFGAGKQCDFFAFEIKIKCFGFLPKWCVNCHFISYSWVITKSISVACFRKFERHWIWWRKSQLIWREITSLRWYFGQ